MLIHVAIKNKVAPVFLEYVGIMEGLTQRLFLFNIVDPLHPNYKSTVAYKVEK